MNLTIVIILDVYQKALFYKAFLVYFETVYYNSAEQLWYTSYWYSFVLFVIESYNNLCHVLKLQILVNKSDFYFIFLCFIHISCETCTNQMKFAF